MSILKYLLTFFWGNFFTETQKKIGGYGFKNNQFVFEIITANFVFKCGVFGLTLQSANSEQKVILP
jgi:hypothetical protein